MYQIVNGDTEKIVFPIQDADLSAVVQPANYPTLRIFDESGDLIPVAVMDTLLSGVYGLDVAIPAGTLGTYVVEFTFYDANNVRKTFWDTLQVIRRYEENTEDENVVASGD